MKPLVSTITTVKNGEGTIEKAIDSILNQTYDNIEIVIVDDGSTDFTPNILRSFTKNNNKINVFFSGGIGRAAALNKAIELSKGDYVSILDADDFFHPQKIELQVNVMDRHTDIFLLSTKNLIIFEDDNLTWEPLKSLHQDIVKINDEIFLKNPIDHSSVMMNKRTLMRMNSYNENLKTQIDYDLWLRAYVNNHEMAIIDNKLTAKRIHKNQSFENKNRLRYTWNNMKLQMHYLTKGKKHYWYLIPIISFLLAQLPFNVRRKINLLTKKII